MDLYKGDLIIIRGLPGSGKSSLAKLLSEAGKYPVYSIDDYFLDVNGTYLFEFKDNFKAYQLCEEQTETSMKLGTSKIFVDNVFSLEWEMQPYFKLASKYQYRAHVITMENRHGGKNVHRITEEQIRKMAEKYQVVLF